MRNTHTRVLHCNYQNTGDGPCMPWPFSPNHVFQYPLAHKHRIPYNISLTTSIYPGSRINATKTCCYI